MLIDNELKLDFKDVLIRPKRSTLTSRKEVDLNRNYTFKHYEPGFHLRVIRAEYIGNFKGIPIMAANMDGVGTFEMADTLAEQGAFACLVKTYSETELVSYFDSDIDNYKRTNHVAMSI